MNARRRFLQSMIAAGVAATLDTDKLLWESGKRLISIPNKPLIDPYPPGVIYYDTRTRTMRISYGGGKWVPVISGNGISIGVLGNLFGEYLA